MNRHALLSVGLLITGIAAATPGCGEETSNGNGNHNVAGETSSAGKDAGAGENTGGTGSVVKPSAGAGGEGGAKLPGGMGGVPEGGTLSVGGAAEAGAGAGGVAQGGAGGEAATCLTSASFGAVGALDGFATEFGDPSGAGWQGLLKLAGTDSVELSVDIYDGMAPFNPNRKTLTNHVLAGPDLNYETCGLCVRVLELDKFSDIQRVFFVTGGTVTLTSVEGRITGSASNLTFEEVTVDPDSYHSTPVPGGCQTSITSASFDESTGAGGEGGAGGAGN